VLQCAVVCCGVLRCAAVCCSVLQCVSVCCSVSKCVCSVLKCVCSVLQGVQSQTILPPLSSHHKQLKLHPRSYTHIHTHTLVHAHTYSMDYVHMCTCTVPYKYLGDTARPPSPLRFHTLCLNLYASRRRAHVHACILPIQYGVALVSRIDKIVGLFCKRAL